MGKFHATLLFAALSGMSVIAQSKFDAGASRYIGQAEENMKLTELRSRGVSDVVSMQPELNAASHVGVLITMKSEGMDGLLRNKGYEIEGVLGRVIMARLTVDQMHEVAAMEEVISVSLGSERKPMMRIARAATGVDEIHSPSASTGIARSFKGKGVILGMMDTGLDPNHINFKDADGNLRINRLWEIRGEGAVTELDTPDKITNYETDTYEGTHGTHVLGIAGGSYDRAPGNGNGSVVTVNRLGRPSIGGTNKNPYYGVAPEAELSVCIGSFSDYNISVSAAKFAEYVKLQGRPGVMNFSLGSQRGPHDGTDGMGLAINEAGKDVLVCVSAGNEGGTDISYSKNLTSADNTIKTCVSTSTRLLNGLDVDIWSSNATPLTIKLVAVDKTTGQIKYEYELTKNSGNTKYYGGTGVPYTNVEKNPQFGTYFGNDGYFGYRSNVSTANNRYNCNVFFQITGGSDQNCAAALIIEGPAGASVDMYGSIPLYSNGIAGFVSGSDRNSINDLACADNVLSVGAYVNSNDIKTFGTPISFVGDPAEGSIASFSSYGKSFAGKQLPEVVGPGMGMVSSYSSYYTKQQADDYIASAKKNPMNTKTDAELLAEFENDYSAWVYTDSRKTRKYYFGEMSGTSMSSPFVAGVLALWAEAAAERGEVLTMDRVKQIIKETADNDEFTAQQPERWGMGKINALAGLKKILSQSSVNSVGADDPEKSLIVENRGGKQFNVFMGGTDGFTANLYNMQGALVASVATEGDNIDLDASAMGDGIYLLEVQARNTRVARKLMVK